MGFTNAGLQAVSSFAAQLGIAGARPARDGSFGFQFARAGHLSITPSQSGGRVAIALARKVAPSDTARLTRLFGLAGFDPNTNRVVQAGLGAEGAVHLVLNLDELELSVATLDAALEQLAALHDRAG